MFLGNISFQFRLRTKNKNTAVMDDVVTAIFEQANKNTVTASNISTISRQLDLPYITVIKVHVDSTQGLSV